MVTPTYISSISYAFGIFRVFINPSKFQTFKVVSFDDVINDVSFIQLTPVMLRVWGLSVLISLTTSPFFPSYKNTFLSAPTETKWSPHLLYLIEKMLLLCYLIDFLNLNGGPSNQHIRLSSPPKANLNGL